MQDIVNLEQELSQVGRQTDRISFDESVSNIEAEKAGGKRFRNFYLTAEEPRVRSVKLSKTKFKGEFSL